MALKLYNSATELFFGAGVYEEGERKKRVNKPIPQMDLSKLPKIPFMYKIIEPTFLEQFKQVNNKDIILPAKVKLNLDTDPRLPYKPRNRNGVYYPELERMGRFIHIGQRKLFLSEIQHLTDKLDHKDELAVVVYAGSAPTNKGWMEHQLFPNVKFLLVDPNMFNIYLTTYRDSHYYHTDTGIVYYGNSTTNYNPEYGVQKCPIRYFNGIQEIIVPDKYADSAPSGDIIGSEGNHKEYINHFYESDNTIFINERYFGNGTAEFVNNLFTARNQYPKFANCKTFFWCDIRTGNGPEDMPTDIDILWNLAMMYNWCRILKPDYAMLKFRTQFEIVGEINEHLEDFNLCKKLGNELVTKDSNLKYFKGEIYHQCWHGRSSTETRLWVNGQDIIDNNLIVYDRIKYEETLFYYNILERLSMLHENPNANQVLGFDHCGDCSLENHIWTQYQKKYDENFNIHFWLDKLCEMTTRTLNRAGHGNLFPIVYTKKANYMQFLALIGGKDGIFGAGAKLPYYITFIDIPFRPLFKDTPRIVRPPKLEFNLKTDKKLDIDPNTLMDNIQDPQTHTLVKEMEKNRWNNFFRRGILSEIWHLVEHLKYDEPAIVISVGTAPGYSTWILHLLFPKVKFVLIDLYSSHFNISGVDDPHYNYYLNADFPIVYFGINNKNYTDFYTSKMNKGRYGIKFYTGNKEILIPSKYEYLDSKDITVENIGNYCDYFYTSENSFFILEQIFDDNLAKAMSILANKRVDYSDHKKSKVFFWTDFLYVQQRVIRTILTGSYDNFFRGYADLYRWTKIIEPDYAMHLFRLSPNSPISAGTIFQPVYDLTKKMGNDMVSANNKDNKLRFFKGVITPSPCQAVYKTYSKIWIDGKDIKNNNLIDYSPTDFVQTITYHNIVERFSFLYENKYADRNLGFDHCGDCAIEGHIWDLYKTKFDQSANIGYWVSWLNKSYGHNLLDNIHGYLFPKATSVDIKISLQNTIYSLVPKMYHKYIKNVTKPIFPKLFLDLDNDKQLDFIKIDNSKYNSFINMPNRKYILSNLYHLYAGPCKAFPYRNFIIIYCESADDNTIWELTQHFPNLRIICFSAKVANIFIEKFGNSHFVSYDNPKNSIGYLTVDQTNLPADDLDIRPITYFNGDDEVGIIDKNSGYKSVTSLADIPESKIGNYSDYIFESTKRIFICEESLTPKSASVLNNILIHKAKKGPFDHVTGYNNSELTLWFNPISAGYHNNIIDCVKILKPGHLKVLFNYDYPDMKFYDGQITILPWSNRQYPEFGLIIDPGTAKMVDYDKHKINNILFYYNLITRISLHLNKSANRDIGYDCCGDCASEARIIESIKNNYRSDQYFKELAPKTTAEIFQAINTITGITRFERNNHGVLYC